MRESITYMGNQIRIFVNAAPCVFAAARWLILAVGFQPLSTHGKREPKPPHRVSGA